MRVPFGLAAGLFSYISITATALLVVGGCSGSGTSTFQNTPDAEPDPGPDPDAAFPLPPDDAGDGATVCTPESVATFTPTFATPEATAQNACTSAQRAAYYDACLADPNQVAACTAFKTNNTACGACLESSDGDAKGAPVLWHSQRKYFTLNVAGCIAAETGDVSATGCGAAYEGALECRRASCDACLSGSGASFQKFSACQLQASSGPCADFVKKEENTCAGVHNGGVGNDCLPPSGSTTKSVYDKLAAKFCGNGGDGGT